MKILLDTHIFLWWLADDSRLAPAFRAAISEAEEATVSTASIWEISLKQQIGKLTIDGDLRDHLIRDHFSVLPVHLHHAVRYRELPAVHRDPFDRMLIVQAQVENLTLVTTDPIFAEYDVELLPAGT